MTRRIYWRGWVARLMGSVDSEERATVDVSLFRASVSAGSDRVRSCLGFANACGCRRVCHVQWIRWSFNTAMGQAEGRYRLALLLAARAGLRRNEIVQVRTTRFDGFGVACSG